MDEQEKVPSKRGRKIRDLTGLRFSALLPLDHFRKNNVTFWNCACMARGLNCVSERERIEERVHPVAATSLTLGKQKTCGCRRFAMEGEGKHQQRGDRTGIKAHGADYDRANVLRLVLAKQGFTLPEPTNTAPQELTQEERDFFEVDIPLPPATE